MSALFNKPDIAKGLKIPRFSPFERFPDKFPLERFRDILRPHPDSPFPLIALSNEIYEIKR